MEMLVNLEDWIRSQRHWLSNYASDLDYDCQTLARANEGDIIIGMIRKTGSEACLVMDDEKGLANVARVFSHVWIDVALYYYCLHVVEITDTGARYGTVELVSYNQAVELLRDRIRRDRENFKGEDEQPYSAKKWNVPRVIYNVRNYNGYLEDYDY